MAKRNRDEEVAFDEAEVTETELEEGEKKKRTPSRKSILRKQIVDYITENTDALPAPLQDMVNELKTMPSRGRGERGPSITGQIKEMILADRKIHEDIFYDKFKAGRLEMKRKFYNMRNLKKLKSPEDAVWVSFSNETGMYTLEGTGAEAPANWVY